MSCLLEVDAHGSERFEVELLHVLRRRLEDELKLRVLEEPIRILAIAAVGRASRGLRIADFVRLGPEHAEKGLRGHGACADFDVVRLLQDAAALGPEALQAEEQLLKGEGGLRLGKDLG